MRSVLALSILDLFLLSCHAHRLCSSPLQVSRTFGVNPFIMWDWDTYFASLLAAESDEMLGYSNVLTVTRGRTIRGQVPNTECAQW